MTAREEGPIEPLALIWLAGQALLAAHVLRDRYPSTAYHLAVAARLALLMAYAQAIELSCPCPLHRGAH